MLSGVVGIRAHASHLEVSPLALLPWFCLTHLRLRGRDVSVVWDALGTKYPHGKGLHVWLDSKLVGSLAPLPATSGDGVPLPPRARVTWDGAAMMALPLGALRA